MSATIGRMVFNPAHEAEAEPVCEEIEAIVACLGDDAAMLREQKADCEIAANMQQAVALIGILLALPAADPEHIATLERENAEQAERIKALAAHIREAAYRADLNVFMLIEAEANRYKRDWHLAALEPKEPTK